MTGIAAFACARSGAFIPGSVVDFQKGERQMNIDYALCEALKAMDLDAGGKVMVIYDVMCQYHVHLWKRISENPFLSFPEKLQLLAAIGLFHVHGHRDECLFRFATSFIPGAGMVDGEILESLWAQLNDISWSTRTSTLAHRSEVLDNHMNYSNWNKMVNIVSSVISKYKKSVLGLVDSQEYFHQLNQSALASDVEKWTEAIRHAEKQREKGHLEAMDIMEPEKPEYYEGKYSILASFLHGPAAVSHHRSHAVTHRRRRPRRGYPSHRRCSIFLHGITSHGVLLLSRDSLVSLG